LPRRAVIIDWPREKCNLYFVGDTHVGAAASSVKAISQLTRTISEDPDALIVGLGDYIEAIACDDRRFDPSELAQPIAPEHISNPFYSQALRFVKLWEPTRGKWAAVIQGNHEATAYNRYHFDATAVIAERLGCAYLGGSDQSGWLMLRLKQGEKVRYRLRVWVGHGWGGGRLSGGVALKLQRTLWRKNADLCVLGHHHRAMTQIETVETINNSGYERTQRRFGLVIPPLVEKHGYIARTGGNSCALGYGVVHIERQHDGQPRLGVEVRTLC